MASEGRLDVLLTERHERILARWETLFAAEPSWTPAAGRALRERVVVLLRALAEAGAGARGGRVGTGREAVESALRGLDPRLAPLQVVRALQLVRQAVFEALLEAEPVDPRSAHSSLAVDREAFEELLALGAGLDEAVSRAVAGADDARPFEAKYRTVCDSIDEAFSIIEVLFEGERPFDFRFLEVNPAFEHHTGVKDAVGRRVREVMPEVEEHWLEVFGRVARTGEPLRFELPAAALRKRFDFFAFRIDAPEQRHVACLFSDVSERRRVEQALREQLALKDQLAKVAASVPGVVCSFRLQPDGRTSMPFSAPAIEDLYGFSQEELARDMEQAFVLTVPEDLAKARVTIAESARTMAPWHQEFRYRHPTKGLRWMEGASIPTREEGGSLIWHGYVADVTERKRAEERLRDANDRLRESDRRKNEFLGMLSHELRNPLAPIRNALYLLDHVEPGGSQAQRAREVATRQVGHLTRLVDDLLDVTRIARGKIELRRADVDLGAIVRCAGEDHRALMEERGLAFELEVPPSPLVVNGDETRLAQVLGNLLGNAAKFTPRGGRVALAVEGHLDRAVIRIRDDGSGVGQEMLESIFEPFTQVTQSLARTEGGLGLGLALVRGLVALHGGTVSAVSEGRGRGTEFVVTLPVAAPAAAVREDLGAGAEPLPSPAPARRRHVLVVDDNHDAAETLAQLVELLGHEAEIAYDGPSAVAMARARPPDVVLCDLGLPGMDGYAVARALRGDGSRRSRLIAVSGYAQPENLATAAAAGFERHVAKPLDPRQLAELLI